MPRVISVIVSADRTDAVTAAVQACEGVYTVQLQRGAALQPEGDVLTIETTNRGMPAVMRLLGSHGLARPGSLSASSSEPLSVVSASASRAVLDDTSEATWEEMECLLARESNMTPNALLVMALSGALAVIGIATNALHIVIAAMAIAPAFEPITRIPLALVAGSTGWQRGLADVAKGYGALAAGAAVTTLLLPISQAQPTTGATSYLPPGSLIAYWTSISPSGIAVSAGASLAGAMLIATNRSVLTAGVMIALALIPTAALVPAGLVLGDHGVAAQAAKRWVIDVALVATMAALLFGWKRYRVLRRSTYIA